MSDVTIPREVAREAAAVIRSLRLDPDDPANRLADLLDPRPTLRDAALRSHREAPAEDRAEVDAVLAVVRDHIAALRNPWHVGAAAVSHNAYKGALRDVLALLDGAES